MGTRRRLGGKNTGHSWAIASHPWAAAHAAPARLWPSQGGKIGCALLSPWLVYLCRPHSILRINLETIKILCKTSRGRWPSTTREGPFSNRNLNTMDQVGRKLESKKQLSRWRRSWSEDSSRYRRATERLPLPQPRALPHSHFKKWQIQAQLVKYLQGTKTESIPRPSVRVRTHCTYL